MMFAVIFARVFSSVPDSVSKAIEVFAADVQGLDLDGERVEPRVGWHGGGESSSTTSCRSRSSNVTVKVFVKSPVLLRAAALVGLGLIIRQIASFETQPYVYFQF